MNTFDKSWSERQEAHYIHWTKTNPENQIQFAFRKHFETFETIYSKFADQSHRNTRRFIELGAGRGSLSAYYAEKGDDVVVSDFSETALSIAKNIFDNFNLKANFEFVDCENVPYGTDTFDICASIGLLEHFENPEKAIKEQYRILNNGGLCFAYIVPQKNSEINQRYRWLNELVSQYEDHTVTKQKDEVFRSDYDLTYYNKMFTEIGFEVVISSGIYNVPMISASPEFPFTLLSPDAERILVRYFESLLDREARFLPWLCEEEFGNAILVVGRK